MNRLAAVARGDFPADLVIHNANVANIFTNTYELSDIAIYSGKIAGISQGYQGRVNFDAQGHAVVPGLIDGHIHIEDTMMTPHTFAQIASLHGTTTVFADPHEITNALGMAGLKFMIQDSQSAPVDIFYGAPSCVPASDYESPYQEMDMSDIRVMFERGMTQHLGEMMNYPAVINGDPDTWGKIIAAGNNPLTGHAPHVTGKNLCAYLSSGINSDHECTSLSEAQEKLSLGMFIMFREGSTFFDTKTLLPLVINNPLNAARCMAVSDDISARYLIEIGHMDYKMKLMLKNGLNPFIALRMITLTPAEYFRLYDRGIIAPGKIADFVILDNDIIDENFIIHSVWKNGRQVVRDDDVFTDIAHENLAPAMRTRATKIPSAENLRVKAQSSAINVIGLTEGTVITKTLTMPAKIVDGYAVSDPENDVAKIVVLERHHDTGRFAAGFVKGLGIKRGAFGSSVAHDAHNFVVAGADDVSISACLKKLAEMGGGLVVADGGNVTASFALPIGGLMSYLPPEKVAENQTMMDEAASNLGVKIAHPFMALSFLCLSVIPELRITDRGYVDLSRGGIQDVFVR